MGVKKNLLIDKAYIWLVQSYSLILSINFNALGCRKVNFRATSTVLR